MKIFPKVKVSNIVQYETDSDLLLLLFNTTSNKAFCLNQTSREIYNLCNGVNEIFEIAEKTKLPENVVKLVINDLSKQDLLMERYKISTSRRELLRNLALTSISLPAITIITAPTAACAASIVCTGYRSRRFYHRHISFRHK